MGREGKRRDGDSLYLTTSGCQVLGPAEQGQVWEMQSEVVETTQKSHRPGANSGSTYSLRVLICKMGVVTPTVGQSEIVHVMGA